MPKAAKPNSTSRRAVPLRAPFPWEKVHESDRLPFVAAGAPGTGRNFWAPRPTGDYAFDCALGEQYARAAVPMMRRDSHLLGRIVLDILAHGNAQRDRGIIVGFMGELSDSLGARHAKLRHIAAISSELAAIVREMAAGSD